MPGKEFIKQMGIEYTEFCKQRTVFCKELDRAMSISKIFKSTIPLCDRHYKEALSLVQSEMYKGKAFTQIGFHGVPVCLICCSEDV